jgi:ATP-dependent protease ClpP protease subunit
MEKRKIIAKKFRGMKRINSTRSDEDEDENIPCDLVTCEENHIFFYDSVNTKSILVLIKYIKMLNIKLALLKTELDSKYSTTTDFNIYLHINSPGGYITDAFSVIDYIKKSEFSIISIVEGQAASAATFLSIVCSKRQITSTSSMLIHQLSGQSSGTYDQLDDDHENNKYLDECIRKLYTTNTNGKLNTKILEKVLKHSLMWDASKCLKYGLVDEII